MAVIAVRCPSCERDNVVKRGRTTNGKQRYLCQDEACSRRTFLLDYSKRGYLLAVKRQIIDLALNGSGIRDTARVLGISGKRRTQRIERKPLRLRTRIKRLTRKTICFSRSVQMHDLIIGLFVNRYEFGLPV
jgi:transposase-like protein